MRLMAAWASVKIVAFSGVVCGFQCPDEGGTTPHRRPPGCSPVWGLIPIQWRLFYHVTAYPAAPLSSRDPSVGMVRGALCLRLGLSPLPPELVPR